MTIIEMADKVMYNQGWIGKVGEEVGEGMGCLELWVGKEGLQVKTIPTGDEVGELKMNGRFAGPSNVASALGEGVLGEDGVLFVKAAFWQHQLEAMKKIAPKHGQRFRIYGKFVAEKYSRQDGTTGTSVKVNVRKFDIVYNNNVSKNVTEEAPAETATAVPETPSVNVPF